MVLGVGVRFGVGISGGDIGILLVPMYVNFVGDENVIRVIAVYNFSCIPFLFYSGNFIRALNKEKRLFFNKLGRHSFCRATNKGIRIYMCYFFIQIVFSISWTH